MSYPAVPDSDVVSGHHWLAKATEGGYWLVLSDLAPDGLGLERACRGVLGPLASLDAWDLTFEGFNCDDQEVWLLSPALA